MKPMNPLQTLTEHLSMRTHTSTRTLLVASAIGCLLGACNPAPTPAPQIAAPIVQGNELRFAPGHPQLALLKTEPAQAATSVTIDMPAKLVWNEEHTQRVFASFAGRVQSIQADIGQRVGPGSVLAKLASPDFGQAQSDANKAIADANLAERALARQRELFGAGIVARKDYEMAEADLARAQAELDRAQGRTKLYGSGASVNQALALTSGIQGIVVERNLNPGQELRPDLNGPGVPPLFVVTDPSNLWIQIDARESELSVALPGTPFEIKSPSLPGLAFQGKVAAVSDYIDPQTRTIKIRGLVPNLQRRLKAEMLVTAYFERKFDTGVIVPAAAVQLVGNRHSAFVKTQDGVFERREVQIGFEGPRQTVLTSGIQPGEKVVIENALLISRMLRMAQEEAKAPEANLGQAAGK